ncbi:MULTISPECIES: hypothetical protein [unclassified Acinetobacter]|uniref:hypothetical protein n=1 Tax=unclassified Acinetobacter TaxID=196816 RepID=UPI0015D21871|nr:MULTISPECIES: hypothetical protein [unclassified Acinetobacter]
MALSFALTLHSTNFAPSFLAVKIARSVPTLRFFEYFYRFFGFYVLINNINNLCSFDQHQKHKLTLRHRSVGQKQVALSLNKLATIFFIDSKQYIKFINSNESSSKGTAFRENSADGTAAAHPKN